VADYIECNPGAGGDKVLADDVTIGGTAGKATGVKIAVGADGAYAWVEDAAPMPVKLMGLAGTGLSVFKSTDDVDETEEEVKASAGTLFGILFTNAAATSRYLKFYNDTATNVTVGTTPTYFKVTLPGNASDAVTGYISIPHGIAFSTAITVAATTVLADNDATAPTSGDVTVTLFYK